MAEPVNPPATKDASEAALRSDGTSEPVVSTTASAVTVPAQTTRADASEADPADDSTSSATLPEGSVDQPIEDDERLPEEPTETTNPNDRRAVSQTLTAASEVEPSTQSSAPASAPDIPANLTPARFEGPVPTVKTPTEALRRRLRGTVVLRGFVAPDGSLSEISILASSGYDLLDDAAQTQAGQWRYRPAYHGSEATGQWVRIPVTFR